MIVGIKSTFIKKQQQQKKKMEIFSLPEQLIEILNQIIAILVVRYIATTIQESLKLL